MKKIFFFIAIFIPLIQVTGQTLNFKSLTSKQGLSHNTVYAITQDAKGFMWIGTRDGINRYDSRTIKSYYLINPYSNEIKSLASYKNNIYIGTVNGLYMYNGLVDSISIINGLENTGSINCISIITNKAFICSDNGLYLLNTKSNKFTRLISLRLQGISIIEDNRLLAVSANSIRIIDFKGNIIKKFNIRDLNPLSNPSFTIHSLYKDKEGLIWIATNKGVFTYKNWEFEKISLPNSSIELNVVRSVTETDKNKIWIGTEAGLVIYDKQTSSSEFYTQSFNPNEEKLTDKSIYSMFTGKDGVVWIGTYFGGINYTSTTDKGFYKILPGENKNGLSGKAVSQIIQDDKGILWIGTEDGGITLYDKKQNTFKYLKHIEGSDNSISINNIHALHDDKEGNIWIGTFMGGLNRYNKETEKFTIYRHASNNPNSISNDIICSIYMDSKKTLWVGTQLGLNIYQDKTGNFSQFKPEIFKNLFIYDIIEDHNNNLWFCTRFNGIFYYNRKSKSLEHFSINSTADKRISSNNIISVYSDTKNNLWFGTLNGGVLKYDPDRKKFSAITVNDGLQNNNVYGILEDANHMIWITTNKGLAKINPVNNAITNYNNLQSLPSNQFNFKSFFKDKEGYLYFGTINGLCYFNEKGVAEQDPPPVHFTAFKLFNKDVIAGPNSILHRQIDETLKVPLSYKDNVFTLDFTSINYTSGNSNYSYYLEGFEEDWNNVDNKQSVTYTNLSPGEYIFHVKKTGGKSNIGNERTLAITVSPPFYLTNWAYFFYFLLIIFSIYAYSYFVKLFHRQKLEVQLERIEKEKIREINDQRLNFFVFISHEFKTPLTIILASIDKMVSDFSDIFKKNPELAFLRNNADRLYSLIEQLMEFRQINSEHTRLELKRINLKTSLTQTLNSFIPLYEKKQIQHIHSLNFTDIDYYIDADKIDKIILNVLSNAVKNTAKNGKIEVSLEIDIEGKDLSRKILNLKITDNGAGMNKEQLEKIYELFYKSAENGSGIGMSLVKSLIDLMDGQINIESELNKGTRVDIKIPVYTKLNKELEKYSSDKNHQPNKLPENLPATELKVEKRTPNHSPETIYTILIAEDNKELLHFLARHLSNKYKVITAASGLSALLKTQKFLPDLVISDVNMPKMSGTEFCKALKSNPKIYHIPIILLSENATEDSRVDGLNVGADAYLCKPFHLKELELILNNIIKSRIMLKEQYEKRKNPGSLKLPRNNKNEEFLNKITVFIEESYANPNLTTGEIAREAGMSRSLLHIKLKKLLNLSASEFLNEYRINKARFLLENDLPISEVAYFTGFSDPSYFSRQFKKHLKTTPKSYKENLRRNNKTANPA